MKKIDSGRMISRVTSLQEENEALHTQIAMLKADNGATKKLAEKFENEVNILLRNNDELRKKIAMQEKALAILKRVCHGSVQDCKPLQK